MELFVKVVRKIIDSQNLSAVSSFVIADPAPVTNRELEAIIRKHMRQKGTTLPIPLTLMSAILRRSFHSKNARFDLATWGEILGVMGLDTVYEPCDTFHRLGIDPSEHFPEKALEPLIGEALRQ